MRLPPQFPRVVPQVGRCLEEGVLPEGRVGAPQVPSRARRRQDLQTVAGAQQAGGGGPQRTAGPALTRTVIFDDRASDVAATAGSCLIVPIVLQTLGFVVVLKHEEAQQEAGGDGRQTAGWRGRPPPI